MQWIKHSLEILVKRKAKNSMSKYCEIEFKNDRRKDIINQKNNAVERAMEAIGMQAEGYAKIACPVDTGNLRNSIGHQYADGDEYIGTNVEYAPYVEFGTSRQKAQPFLKPAASEHAEEYKAIFQTVLKDKIK